MAAVQEMELSELTGGFDCIPTLEVRDDGGHYY